MTLWHRATRREKVGLVLARIVLAPLALVERIRRSRSEGPVPMMPEGLPASVNAGYAALQAARREDQSDDR